MPTPVLKARAALGVASRARDPHATADARRNLAAAKLEQYIEQVVSAAPPLTPEQADRIAGLLRTSSVAA